MSHHASLQHAVHQGHLPGLHALLALQRGRTVLEAYWDGEDERIGYPPAFTQHGPDVRHDLRSVTKTIVGLLCGLVVSERGIDVDAPLSELLPLRRAQLHEATAALTLRHVLTMTMGLAWDESLSYADPRNSEIQMARAPDRVAYDLGRPAAEPPGTRWHYCGGATELLAELITHSTGSSLASFAQQRLFGPLGLKGVEWTGDPSGPYAASGLRMTARELARVGQLVLQEGTWEGRVLLPRGWLEQAARPHVQIEGDFWYGYHAYLVNFRVGERPMSFIAGMGNGGQRLYVLPELHASVAVFCGNYNDWTLSRQVPARLLRDHVLPLLAAE